VKKDLDVGVRSTRPFERMAEMKEGEFFIVGGQMAHVAEVGEEFISEYGRRDSRLRVIYDNGTESDVLLRSLQRALHRDEAGRRITNLSAGPLFSDKAEEGDLERVGPFTSCVTSRSIRLSQSIVRFCTRLA
jgi:hypothetical protein